MIKRLIIILLMLSISIVSADDGMTEVKLGRTNELGFLTTGSAMVLLDGDGNIIDTWTSGKEYRIHYLKDGSYSLVSSIDKRNTTSSLRFKVENGNIFIDDKQVSRVVIKDNYTYLFNSSINLYFIIGGILLILAIIIMNLKHKK